MEQLYEEMKHEDKTGFFAEITNLTGKVVYVVFYAGETKSVHVVHLQPAVILRKKIEKYVTGNPREVQHWQAKLYPKSGRLQQERYHIRNGLYATFRVQKNWNTREEKNSNTSQRSAL